MDFRLISSILILLGLIFVLLDYYMFQAETLFFQLEQIPFGILKSSIHAVNTHLDNMIESLDGDSQRVVFEISKPIKELAESLDTIEKSNIVIAGSLIDAKEAYFAFKELSKKQFGIFEEQEK